MKPLERLTNRVTFRAGIIVFSALMVLALSSTSAQRAAPVMHTAAAVGVVEATPAAAERNDPAPEVAPMFGETVAAASNALTSVKPATGAARIQAPATSSAPDESKYTLKVPGGLAFSEFRGYEDWAVVAVQHTQDLVKVVVGNPMTMDAFRAGVPGNGKPFPDGSKMAKVEWGPKKSADAPYDITVPGTVYDLDFMVKDSKRFADSGGWGYAVFKHDAASGTYTPATLTHKPPQGNDSKCGTACHTIAKAKDYVFTEYAKR